MPALLAAAHQKLGDGLGAFLGSLCSKIRGISIGGAEDGADTGGLEAVDKVMDFQLVGSRDGHSAQLMQCHHGRPELVVPFQHQHDLITLFDTQRGEIVGVLVGQILDIF